MKTVKNLIHRGLVLVVLASFVAAPLPSYASIFPTTTETLVPYNHGYISMTSGVTTSVWLEDDPDNSYLAGFTYSTDPTNPQYYYQEVTTFLGIVGTNGVMNAGDITQVQSWRVMFIPIGNASTLDNNVTIHQARSAPMTLEFRVPTNSQWYTPFGVHRSGMNIYQLSFYLWNLEWLATANYQYVVVVAPVFKDANHIPFYVVTFMSEGINPLSWTNVATGLNVGMDIFPLIPGQTQMLNFDGYPAALFMGDPNDPLASGDIFMMMEMETAPYIAPYYTLPTPPTIAPPAKIQKADGSVGIIVTNGTVNVTYGPLTSGHIYNIDTANSIQGPWTLDQTIRIATTTGTYTNVSYPQTGQTTYYRVITDGIQPAYYTALLAGNTHTGLQTTVSSTMNLASSTSAKSASVTAAAPTNNLSLAARHAAATQPKDAPPLITTPPIIPFAQAMQSVSYAPSEARAALAKAATVKATALLAAQPSLPADFAPVQDDKNRIVAWENNAASSDEGRTRLAVALKTVTNTSPAKLQANDPNTFYAPFSQAEQFISQYGAFWGLQDPNSELAAHAVCRDGLGMTHARYAQSVSGIPVYGAEAVVHVNAAGVVTYASGMIAPTPTVATVPEIPMEQARQTALRVWHKQPRAFSAGSASLGDLQILSPSLFMPTNAPEFSEDEDVDAPVNFNKPPRPPGNWAQSDHLTWRVRVSGEDGDSDLTYFIDAHTGKPLWVLSNVERLNRVIYNCNNSLTCKVTRTEGGPATGVADVDTMYNLLGNIVTYLTNEYGLNGANGQGGLSSTGGETDAKVNFNPAYFGGLEGGAHFLSPLYITQNGDPGQPRIEFSSGWVDPLVSPHEYFHGVEFYAHLPNGMTYQGEPGALMEAGSNIFGEAFKTHYYTDILDTSVANDWKFVYSGYPLPPTGSYLQGLIFDLAYPENSAGVASPMGYADSNYGPYKYCSTGDYSGVHYNSYLISKGAWLAANGGFFNNCTITGIGMENVHKIFYHAMANYYSASASFAEAYTDLKNAGSDYYPKIGTSLSPTILQLAYALNAVEMNQPGRCSTTARLLPACSTKSCLPYAGGDSVSATPYVDYFNWIYRDRNLPLTNLRIHYSCNSDVTSKPTFTFQVNQ